MIEIKEFEPKYTKQISDMIIRNLLEVNIKDYGIERVKEMAEDFNVEKLDEKLRGREKVYVALKDNEVVGTAGLDKSWYSNDEYWILTVFVKPEEHGHNIGKKLVKKLEEYAKKLPIKKIVIPASITACEFYYKLGYRYIKGKKELNSEDMYIMEKYI